MNILYVFLKIIYKEILAQIMGCAVPALHLAVTTKWISSQPYKDHSSTRGCLDSIEPPLWLLCHKLFLQLLDGVWHGSSCTLRIPSCINDPLGLLVSAII